MGNLRIDKNFKLTFNKVSLNNSEQLLQNLSSIFDLPEFHFSRSILHRYYRKYPELYFDKDIANKVLRNFFQNANCFILDYGEPYFGGYSRNNAVPNPDELINNPEPLKIMTLNWGHFVDEVKNRYWQNQNNIDRFKCLANFDLFKERTAISPREQFLTTPQIAKFGEKTSLIKYNFFNVSETLKYYERLIGELYPDLKLLKNSSTTKVKRYATEIGRDIFLGIYIDYSFLEKEMNNTYLELPSIKVEVFSGELKKGIQEKEYLKGQSDVPIARIDLHYFMGNPIHSRIGNSSEDPELLKKNLFFYSEVYSFYLLKYLQFITTNLLQVLN